VQQIGLQKREAAKSQGRGLQARVQNPSPTVAPTNAGSELPMPGRQRVVVRPPTNSSASGEDRRTERRGSRTPELFSMAAADSPNPDSRRLCRDTSLEAIYGGLNVDQKQVSHCASVDQTPTSSPSTQNVALEVAAFVATAGVATAAAGLEEHNAIDTHSTLAVVKEETAPTPAADGALPDPAEQPQVALAQAETFVKLSSITSSEVTPMDDGGASTSSALVPQASTHGQDCSIAAFAAAGPAYTAPAELMTCSDGQVEEVSSEGFDGTAKAAIPASSVESEEEDAF